MQHERVPGLYFRMLILLLGTAALAAGLAVTYREFFSRMPFMYCRPGDRDVVNSLTRSSCMTWLASHRLPQHVQYFSLGGFTRRQDIHPMMLLTYDLLSTLMRRLMTRDTTST